MTPADEIARVAAGLTKAQRELAMESAPGGWGRDDTATGAEVYGAGRWSVARSLVRKRLGDIYEQPELWPPALYFHNQRGLSVAAHLREQGR